MTRLSRRISFSAQGLKKIFLVVALVLCGLLGFAHAAGLEKEAEAGCKENVIYSQKIMAGSRHYLLEFKRGGCSDSIDTLSFYSLNGDKKVLLREDDETNYFISAAIFGDNAEYIYVLSESGAGYYEVDVYFIASNNIDKILSVGSDFPPNFMMFENRQEALLIDRNDRHEKRIPNIYDVYEFEGKKVIHHKDVKFFFPKKFGK
jgi:hypothetical protein